MAFFLESYWAPIASAVAGVVYAVRMEGKIDVHEEKFKTMEARFESQDKIAEHHSADIISRLDRIERKQDAAVATVNHSS